MRPSTSFESRRVPAHLRAALLAVVLGTIPGSAFAAWPSQPAMCGVPLGPAIGNPRGQAVLTGDGAIVAWFDFRNGNADLFAQRVDGSGFVQWAADAESVCTAPNQQARPEIVGDGSGGAILVWEDDRNGTRRIHGQRLSPDAEPLWAMDGVAVSAGDRVQGNPKIVTDGAGGAIVTWQEYRGGSYDIVAQRWSPTAARMWGDSGVVVCSAALDQYNRVLQSDGAGGAISAWDDARGGAFTPDVYAQRVNATGQTLWTANGAALCVASGPQYAMAIVSDGAGGAIVVWNDHRSGGQSDVYARRINAAGTALWAADGVVLCSAPNDQLCSSAVPDASGGAIVVWEDPRDGNTHVYAQRVGPSGAIQWAPNGIGVCTGPSFQDTPVAASDFAGGVIVAWIDYRNANPDVYAQRLNGQGTAQWSGNGVPVCTAAGGQLSPAIGPDGAGGAIVAFYDSRMYAQRILWNGALASVPATRPSSVRLSLEGPNPGREASMRLELERPARVDVDVLDLTGRVVARLAAGVGWVAGRHFLTWDGRDAIGREVPSGLYFVRARSPEESRSLKWVRAR